MATFPESLPPPSLPPPEFPTAGGAEDVSFRQFFNLKGTQLGTSVKKSQSTFYLISSLTIIATALLIATSSIGINVYNSCVDFNGSKDRVAGLQTFFIAMLIISILGFAAAIAGLVIYIRYWKNIAV